MALTVYSNCSVIDIGCFLYTDSGLTTPVPDGKYSQAYTDCWTVSGGLGEVTGNAACGSTTTTTTTTASYLAFSVRLGDGLAGLCNDVIPTTVYTALGGSISIGNFIYLDSALTMPVDSYFYVVQGNQGDPGTIYEVDTSGEIVADSGLSCS